jgi:hypothetical protein
MKNIKWIILIVIAVSLLVSPCVNAEFVEGKESLRGIKGVMVVVDLGKMAESYGGIAEKIQTDVELKLRMAGIKIKSIEEYAENPTAYLAVEARFIFTPKITTIFKVGIYLVDIVRPLRNPNTRCWATTWRKEYLAFEEKARLEKTIRDQVKDLADQFLNDYLAVNPKQVDKPKKK